jgi:glycosyltransferase involved in cell wall biosynthesis
MKLVVQIPCLNEAESLPPTLAEIPRAISGIDSVETLVVDDGSTDETLQVARSSGVDYIVSLKTHLGLARAFASGLDAALRVGADVIVNLDADGQYPATDIAALVAPILCGEADIVIGDRDVDAVHHFSAVRRLLQRWGSSTVSRLAGLRVTDVTSGFRAFSRDAALRLNVLGDYTYTLETIIQAGHLGMSVVSVATSSRPTRPSRLFSSELEYVRRTIPGILRAYLTYEPLGTFLALAASAIIPGTVIGLRFVYLYISGDGAGHVQSLILAAVLLLVGFQTLVLGLVARLLGTNRRLVEECLYRVRKLDNRAGATDQEAV